MRYLYRFLIILCLLFSSSAYAVQLFLDALYWQASETAEWAALNNMNASNQQITYKTISYDYRPGYRIGIAAENNWDSKFSYTKYTTNSSDRTTGNITSGFLAARLALTGTYQAEQVNFNIDFNMFDLNVGKHFNVSDKLMLRPIVGLMAGWINQTINSHLQGTIFATENIKNDFSGIGPKVGIEGSLDFLRMNNYQFNLVGAFAAGYMWGHWEIEDVLHYNPPSTGIDKDISLNNRNFGALAIQAFLGAGFNYKKFTANLGWEINDYFNQYQVFDNGTGAHNNDLILQGLTLNLAYSFN